MVKGWSEKDGNRYYFDPTYGTMAKGYVSVDGMNYADNDNDIYLQDEKKYVYRAGVPAQTVHDVYAYDSTTQTVYKEYSELENYNAGGTRVENVSYTYYRTTGDVNYSAYYEYDGNGKLLSYYKCNSDGSVNSRKSYEYNDRGLKTKETEYGTKDMVKQTKTYE